MKYLRTVMPCRRQNNLRPRISHLSVFRPDSIGLSDLASRNQVRGKTSQERGGIRDLRETLDLHKHTTQYEICTNVGMVMKTRKIGATYQRELNPARPVENETSYPTRPQKRHAYKGPHPCTKPSKSKLRGIFRHLGASLGMSTNTIHILRIFL